MARSGETVTNPVAGMTLLFVKTAADTDGELLEMEATYEPSSMPPIPHFHPSQREHFEILEGTMHARIDGAERELRAGDEVDVEAGTVHAMWNEGPEPARTLWQTRPALRTEEFFEQTAAVFREAQEQGRDPDGEKLAEIVQTFSDEFRLGDAG
jgi:mannose-6-phosphate isomerase-like protein (cupin superfamily)